ncbi:transposase [Palleronia aestuarii]|uniref:Transposase n=1 Tax=Palleronia aestuarii TaxID=568105 RepID=A0A2W7NF65_9RHOB|nr:IS1182 family transposase [Palleronia aestuarii]PZX11786.1 transposase [Palleronia aestuarii]
MMGRQTAPAKLFYDFDLESHIPADHLLRKVDRFLDLGDIRARLRPFYSHLGRPSIDPELVVRMLLIGYLTGIRSERRLCEEVHVNLAHRWFCRLGLDGRVPDHSTFSKYRHGKFRDSDLLRLVFEGVVARCIEEGLVGGAGFAVDASLILADVAKMNSSAQAEWDIDAIDTQKAPRAVREYLETLDDAAFGAATPVLPKFVSHADPASQWTAAQKRPAVFTYSDNYLIDTDNAVILDVEATRSIRQAEVGAARTMVDRVEQRFGLKPTWLTADTAYGSAETLDWVVRAKKIVPFIPVFDKSTRTDGTWSRSDFIWEPENDRYLCPEGHELLQYRRNYSDPSRGQPKEGRKKYRAQKSVCQACPSKLRCCPNADARFVTREEHEDVRDLARECVASEVYKKIAGPRRRKVEMLFAHLKRILGLGRLRLRGPCGAKDEFTLAAIAQNLRKLAKLRPQMTMMEVTV